ncbi:MAG: YncE family protein, partial [Phycisphaerae bacterium]
MNTRHIFRAVALLLLLPNAAIAQAHRQKLYVLSSNATDMTVIDVATNQIIGSVEVGPLPHGLAAPASQDVLYVSTEGDGGLTVVDPVTDRLVKQYRIFGKRPNEIDVTSDGRYVYVPTYGAGVYEVFDTVKEEIVARIPTDGLPHN